MIVWWVQCRLEQKVLKWSLFLSLQFFTIFSHVVSTLHGLHFFNLHRCVFGCSPAVLPFSPPAPTHLWNSRAAGCGCETADNEGLGKIWATNLWEIHWNWSAQNFAMPTSPASPGSLRKGSQLLADAAAIHVPIRQKLWKKRKSSLPLGKKIAKRQSASRGFTQFIEVPHRPA